MKKLLLSLACAASMVFGASAADVTVTPAQLNLSGSVTVDGFTIDIQKNNGSTAPALSGANLRLYAKNTMAISGEKVAKVVFTFASDNGYRYTTFTPSTGAYTTEQASGDTELTWTGDATAITFTVGDKATFGSDGASKAGQIRLASVTISGEGGEGGDTPVTPPVDIANTPETAYTATKALELIAAGEGLSSDVYVQGEIKSIKEVSTSYGNATYTITDGTSDLTIFRGYYLEGAKFTAEDQIKVGQKVIVYGKLTSYNGEGQMNQGNKIYSIDGEGGDTPTPEKVEVSTLAALKALAVNTPVKFTANATAVYQHQSSLYLTDGTDWLLVYGKLNTTYTNGTVLTGFEGTVGEYNGIKQLTPAADTFTAGTAGTAVEPTEMAIEEVASDLACEYVKFVGVTIAATENARTFTMSDESGSITLYQNWTDIEIPTGEGLTVTGFIGMHSGVAQILCVTVTTASGLEVVAAPVFSVTGAVAEGTLVTLTCDTEGATIYYTVDGAEPTTASAVYTEPIAINEEMTIKAIAAKAGMETSSVATASYTIKAPVVVEGNQATFDFTDIASLTPAYNADQATDDGTTGNKLIDVKGVEFQANGVTVVNAGEGTAARLYYQPTKDAWTYRIYKKTTLIITCQSGYALESIAFETQTTSYATALGNSTFSTGTFADGVLSFPAQSANDVNTVSSVTITPSATIGFNKMTVTFKPINGVNDIEIDANAPVEFYNLQGVRVEGELTPGLYIRRQGNTASKVLVK